MKKELEVYYCVAKSENVADDIYDCVVVSDSPKSCAETVKDIFKDYMSEFSYKIYKNLAKVTDEYNGEGIYKSPFGIAFCYKMLYENDLNVENYKLVLSGTTAKEVKEESHEPIIPRSIKEALKNSYESNKECLDKLAEYIKEHGQTEDGLSDADESFEKGYNNALEFVFRTLGINY